MNKIFTNINFATIDNCNRSCTWCPNVHDMRKTGELMEFNVLDRLLLQLKDISFQGVISPFGNNESLLDDRIFDIINEIKRHMPNNLILIHTNGDMLFNEEIFQKFCNSKLDAVIINCYDGIEQYQKFQKMFESAGDTYNYGRYFKYGKHIELRLTTEPAPHFWNRGGSVDLIPTITTKCCFIPFQWMTVNHKGDVYLCCGDWAYEQIFGNIREKNILDIWNCSEYNKYREYHLAEKGKLLPLCSKCNRIS